MDEGPMQRHSNQDEKSRKVNMTRPDLEAGLSSLYAQPLSPAHLVRGMPAKAAVGSELL
jgi:hypothetical protein